MPCLSFFITKKKFVKKLCVGTCLKCLTVATPLDLLREHCQINRIGGVISN